jgi:transcriptional regulator with XRE-family HTH domain
MHTVHMNRLAKLREQKGLRQEDLAAMIGVDKAKISRAENEHKSAMLSTYRACAEALEVPLSAIFSDELTPEERWFLDMLRALPEQWRPQVRALMELARSEPQSKAPQSGDADRLS